jgi:acetolactate synthase small subunit
MQAFHIRYRNTQGTLMRILNAASRRALDLPSVVAEPAEQDHRVTLLLDVNPKQVGQLYREWNAIADVIAVHSSTGLEQAAGNGAAWNGPHPPASTGREEARAALA